MADSFCDFWQGSPEQRLADLEKQRRELEAIRATPEYRALRSMRDSPIETRDYSHDPRAIRMNMTADSLYPHRTTDAGYVVGSYLPDFGGRMRDTAFSAIAAGAKGDIPKALELGGRSLAAGAIPYLGAGMRGEPDDWRATALKNGVSPGWVATYDIATDPEMWVTAPVRGPAAFVVPGVPWRMVKGGAKAADAGADVLKRIGVAADQLRYGRGSPAYLIDESGEVIRRLRNAPEAPRLGLEYSR